MIIKVKQPRFFLDKNNCENVSYDYETGANWKVISVGTYLHGFPKLKKGEVLYKYTSDRGYLTTYITDGNRKRIDDKSQNHQLKKDAED